ncbi:hypothetical protein ABVB69_13225 [Streptomyces sp. NPDC000349]|uniref:hypothetical protein n=1 Tax=unclassified Streptomyces TaxID=2593676 RepID=UPI00277F40B8|nr:hypothetical protein [Streptomyces sp. DSM 40167]MDQ0405296.1 hypothetical protein [Streptomyces sp. DSM 40167]
MAKSMSPQDGNPPPYLQRLSAWWHRNRRAIRRRFVLGLASGAGSSCMTLIVVYAQHRG